MLSEDTDYQRHLDEFEESLKALEEECPRYLREDDLAVVERLCEALRGKKGNLVPEVDANFRSIDALQSAAEHALSCAKKVLRSRHKGCPLTDRERELFGDLKFYLAAEELCLAKAAINNSLGFFGILHGDPSGETPKTAATDLFGVRQPTIDHTMALFTIFQRSQDNPAKYAGKPRKYFATGVWNEVDRLQRDRDVEYRNRLGLTPKELNVEDADRARLRDANASDLTLDEIKYVAVDAEQEELLFSLEAQVEEERRLEQELGSWREDQARIFRRAYEEGLSLSEARRRLGLPESTERALRSRLTRLRLKRAASG